jgi:hypothetical protein
VADNIYFTVVAALSQLLVALRQKEAIFGHLKTARFDNLNTVSYTSSVIFM